MASSSRSSTTEARLFRPPAPSQPGQPDLLEGGRGLRLVEMLATRWGYHRDTAGTVTWFELTRDAPE